jgi:hypothetical protein
MGQADLHTSLVPEPILERPLRSLQLVATPHRAATRCDTSQPCNAVRHIATNRPIRRRSGPHRRAAAVIASSSRAEQTASPHRPRMSVHSHAAHLHIYAYLTIYLAIRICTCIHVYSYAALVASAPSVGAAPHGRVACCRALAAPSGAQRPRRHAAQGGTRRRAARLERSLRTYVRIGGELPGGCNGQRRRRRLQHARVLQLDVAVLGELAEGLLQRMMAPRCDALTAARPRPRRANAATRANRAHLRLHDRRAPLLVA